MVLLHNSGKNLHNSHYLLAKAGVTAMFRKTISSEIQFRNHSKCENDVTLNPSCVTFRG